MSQHHYRAPTAWEGRVDSPIPERFHQWIQCYEIDQLPQASQQPAFALLGFCSDAGVARNKGRVGAAKGPMALRKALSSLAVHVQNPLWVDCGDVVCEDHDLEAAQAALAEVVATIVARGYLPIVMGGGHEVAWGHYQGLAAAGLNKGLQIINFDAHFDLRPLSADGLGSSGTPFLQIAQDYQKQRQSFQYLALGIDPCANTHSLYQIAEKFGVEWVEAEALLTNSAIDLVPILSGCERIYLTLCLDVFAAHLAPGVSAPAALGLTLETVMPLLKTIMATKKVVAVDIAELNPRLDLDQRTAKLAARLLLEVLNA